MNWKQVEMMGYAYFCEKGYRVLVSLVDNSDYDFVVEKDGFFTRVNVKTAGIKEKSQKNSWSITLSPTAGEKFKKGVNINVDLFLVWLPEHEKFLELPGSFFNGGTSKCRRIPQAMLF